MTSTGRLASASEGSWFRLARRIADWIGTKQQAISDRAHANGDAYAVTYGWTVTASTGRFGFGARTYRDLRLDSLRRQSCPDDSVRDRRTSRAQRPRAPGWSPIPVARKGSTMTFDPAPRQASEYQKGAAFGHATVMWQIDGGVPADRIQQTQEAAKHTLAAAARTDGEREFCDGYTAAVDSRIATLRAVQRAEATADPWERAAERRPEREVG
jgi:hypothetical protein